MFINPKKPINLGLIILILMRRGNLHSSQLSLQKNNRALKLLVVLLLLSSLACNAFAGNLEPFPDPPQLDGQGETPLPADSMSPTATLDDAAPAETATVTMLVDLNIRNGPGVQFDRIGYLSKGSSVAAIGVDKQTGWWKIQCPTNVSGDACWVSGGAQYVEVDNGQNVPTAEAPATPTTAPPTIDAGRGWLAFINDGQLFVAGLDLGTSPLTLSSAPDAISKASGIQRFKFSPDGRRIAYTAGTSHSNSLNVVNVDGGDHRTLVTSSILPVHGGQEAAQLLAVIDELHWLPDNNSVVFNTAVRSQFGPAGGSQEDVWIATLEGELIESFSAGEGGGRIVVERDGSLLLSRATELARAAPEAQEQSVIYQFEQVNTASEYAYYPLPQVTSDGTYVAVPAADPWAVGAQTTLLTLPADALAAEIGRVTDAATYQPVTWSSDGQLMALVQRSNDPQSPVRMFIAAYDGSDAVPYAGDANLVFFEWKPQGDQFLYAGTGFYALGQPRTPSRQYLLPAGQMVSDARWVTNEEYIVAIVDTANQTWELQSADVSGAAALLTNGNGQNPAFAVWLP